MSACFFLFFPTYGAVMLYVLYVLYDGGGFAQCCDVVMGDAVR